MTFKKMNYKTENDIDNNLYKDLLNNSYLKDADILYIFKKTERLVTAIYMVTDQLLDEEALKRNIRESITELLIDVTKIGYLKYIKKSFNIPVSFYKTVGLLDSLHLVGLIGKNNFEVLRTELNNLAKEINNYINDVSESDKAVRDMAFVKKDIIKDKKTYKRHTQPRNVLETFKETKPEIPKSDSMNDRKDQIINLIKEKGEISVKDVAFKLQNFSEKTLQRDLLQLVKEGVLKKEGERRWSRYSLNT